MLPDIHSVAAAGRTDVLAALRTASKKTGLDFNYLLNTAMRESGLNIQAKSKTSSAAGLFQFVEQTWLGLVKHHGAQYGLGSYAAAIQETPDGHFSVASADTKSAILALRQNPELAAVMAGESAKQTKQTLECALGREVFGGELYAAHFLGPNAARKLIQLNDTNPNSRADVAFPQAAKANKSAFYNADGTAKSVREVYAWAVGQQDTATTKGAPVTAPPAVTPATPAVTKSQPIDIASLFPSMAAPERVEIVAPRDDADEQPAYRDRSTAPTEIAVATIQPRSLPQPPVVLNLGVVQVLASLGMPARQAA
jgi:hypothetical protein